MEDTTKISLKLLVDARAQRVLFAEASKDFVDFLFAIMALPVAVVARLLNKEGAVGSLGNLYESIENLSNVYLQPFQDKDSILKPKISTFSATTNLPHLLPDMESLKDSRHKVFYKCVHYCYYITEDQATKCPQCRTSMNRQVKLIETERASFSSSPSPSSLSSEGEGGFVKGVVTYMVMDDLMVKPMSTISSITLLNKFNVKDVGALEEMTIKMGMDEAVNLIKTSLQSKTVLTDVFLGKKKMSNIKST